MMKSTVSENIKLLINSKIIAMIKIAGVKSNDKINFKEFVDFFYKIDWCSLFTISIISEQAVNLSIVKSKIL